jgi:trimethylamine--corrinoid protein Co-methyltransferase
MEPIRIQFLSREQREHILEAALTVLESGRARVEDEAILRELARRGAPVSGASGDVRLPRGLVESALATVDRAPVLRTVSGKPLHLHGRHRYYGSLCIDPFVLDYARGLRPPVVADVARHARLGDALPRVDLIYKMDQACTDAPGILSDVRTLEAFAANTTAAYLCAPASLESAQRWVEVAEIMAGGDLRSQPVLLAYVAPISPFRLNQEAIAMMRLLSERGAMIRGGPCPMAGATSPYALAGTLVQSVAEILLQLVVGQVIRPGAAFAPIVGGAGMDMRSGNCLYGGPVKDVLHVAAIEMIEHLDLPSTAGFLGTICANYGLQNGVESAFSAMLGYPLRNHVMFGMGSLANACGVGTEQIVLHHDLVDLLEWYAAGINTATERLSIGAQLRIGPDGDYLCDPTTLELLRSAEHFAHPDFVACRGGGDQTTLLENLHARAEQLIAEHRPAVPEDRLERVREYLRRIEKTHA